MGALLMRVSGVSVRVKGIGWGELCAGVSPGSCHQAFWFLDFGELGPQHGECLRTGVLGLLPLPHWEGGGSSVWSQPRADGRPGCCLGVFFFFLILLKTFINLKKLKKFFFVCAGSSFAACRLSLVAVSGGFSSL